MRNKSQNTPLHKRQSKVNGFKNEEQTIFLYLQNRIATASMISIATGIPQKNICRYKADLQQRNLLFEVYRITCLATGFKAWYLTTSKALYRKEVKNAK